MKELFSNVNWLATAVTVFFGLLSLLLVYVVLPKAGKLPELTRKLFDWVYAKADTAKNAYVAGLLERLTVIVRDTVLHLENTMIEDLKEKAADGKLTKEELLVALLNVRQHAIDTVKEMAKLEGLFEVLTTLVFGDEAKLTAWITSHVETQVSTLPPSGLQTVKNGNGVPAMAVGELKRISAPAVPPTAAASNA